MSDMHDAGTVEVAVGPVPDVPCRACGRVGGLRIETREEMVCLPPPDGTAFAGVMTKYAARTVAWPWMVCGLCGAECKGKRG